MNIKRLLSTGLTLAMLTACGGATPIVQDATPIRPQGTPAPTEPAQAVLHEDLYYRLSDYMFQRIFDKQMGIVCYILLFNGNTALWCTK